jgi:NADH dehydrogenase
MPSPHRVVIVGGGFGGLDAALALRRAPVQLTLLDRRNVHVFQPLLYQVATGGLSPGDIVSPLRWVLRRQGNAVVWLAEVADIDARGRRVMLADGEAVGYDTLVVATGAGNHYFGHDEWAPHAPSLKTVEDAVEIRRRVLLAFEAAERERNPERRQELVTFVVVGGGPTGVELAGALSELARDTLRHDFRCVDPRQARIILVEGADRALPSFPATLSRKAARSLTRLGVTVRTGALVTDVTGDHVDLRTRGLVERIPTRTVLWAAGVQGSPLGGVLAAAAGAELDRAERVRVAPDLTVPGYPEIFVIGDLAHVTASTRGPLPGLAPVAKQQGRYVAMVIRRRLRGEPSPPFRYRDRGTLATIGRAAAVADMGRLRFSGYPAWLLWLFVHLMFLIEFQNRVLVLIQWAWHYFTRNRGARIITDARGAAARSATLVPAESVGQGGSSSRSPGG